MENNSLEDRLRRTFNESSKFAHSNNTSDIDKKIKFITKAFYEEEYSYAKTLIKETLKSDLNVKQQIYLLDKRIEANKIMFEKTTNKLLFKEICEDYENLLDIQEVPEIYISYIEFLEDLSFKEAYLDKEAVKIAERGVEVFPDNPNLNAKLSGLYFLVSKDELSYDVMVKTCKIAYEDPNFLYSSFFNRLFEPAPKSNNDKTIPINILLNFRDQEILSNLFLLHDYAKLVDTVVIDQKRLAYWLYTRVYDLNKNILGIKKEIIVSFNDALFEAKDDKERSDLQEHLDKFARKHNLHNDRAWTILWSSKYNQHNSDEGFIDENPPEEERALTKHPNPPKNKKPKTLEKKIEVLLPKQIKEKLDQYVVGQEQAKKALAVAASNHLLRISGKTKGIEKTNVLLLGPTGCGKTFSARILSQVLDLPFVIYDTSKITSAGYIGDNATDCLYMLYKQCGGDLKRTEQGIVFLDEADKIKKTAGSGKDIGGEGAQQQLLKLIEGSDVNVEISRNKAVTINTEDIMFIVAGAFSDTLNGESLGQKISGPKIGFNSCEEETIGKILRRLTDKHLQDYGFLPEFAGRLQKRAILDELKEEQLKKILIEPKNALIPQYEKQFHAWKIRLDVDDSAISKIAQEACKLGAGARSLKTICESIFDEYLFNLPGTDTKVLKITEKEVLETLEKARS